jgi:hypothetical protein
MFALHLPYLLSHVYSASPEKCDAPFLYLSTLLSGLLLLLLQDAARRLGGGQQLDVLVVNSYCSTAQVGAAPLMRRMTRA